MALQARGPGGLQAPGRGIQAYGGEYVATGDPLIKPWHVGWWDNDDQNPGDRVYAPDWTYRAVQGWGQVEGTTFGPADTPATFGPFGPPIVNWNRFRYDAIAQFWFPNGPFQHTTGYGCGTPAEPSGWHNTHKSLTSILAWDAWPAGFGKPDAIRIHFPYKVRRSAETSPTPCASWPILGGNDYARLFITAAKGIPALEFAAFSKYGGLAYVDIEGYLEPDWDLGPQEWQDAVVEVEAPELLDPGEVTSHNSQWQNIAAEKKVYCHAFTDISFSMDMNTVYTGSGPYDVPQYNISVGGFYEDSGALAGRQSDFWKRMEYVYK